MRKKVKVAVSPCYGRTLRLSNQTGRGRGRSKERGVRNTPSFGSQPWMGKDNLCEVEISPTKELKEVGDKLREG